MITHVTFKSNAFPPYEDEDQKINPGRYGKRLAEFLVLELPEHGFEPLDPIAEDWGWVVPIKNDNFKLWIACGNSEESLDSFLCFIEPHQATIRKFPFLRKTDTSAKVTALQQAMDRALSGNPNIREKRWWTHEEFSASGQPPSAEKRF